MLNLEKLTADFSFELSEELYLTNLNVLSAAADVMRKDVFSSRDGKTADSTNKDGLSYGDTRVRAKREYVA